MVRAYGALGDTVILPSPGAILVNDWTLAMSSLSAYSDHAFVAEGVNTSWSNLYTFVPDGSRVLDFGCSTGNFGAALKNLKNCEVVGVDINESDVAIAKTQLDAAFVLDITMPEAAQVLGLSTLWYSQTSSSIWPIRAPCLLRSTASSGLEAE